MLVTRSAASSGPVAHIVRASQSAPDTTWHYPDTCTHTRKSREACMYRRGFAIACRGASRRSAGTWSRCRLEIQTWEPCQDEPYFTFMLSTRDGQRREGITAPSEGQHDTRDVCAIRTHPQAGASRFRRKRSAAAAGPRAGRPGMPTYGGGSGEVRVWMRWRKLV